MTEILKTCEEILYPLSDDNLDYKGDNYDIFIDGLTYNYKEQYLYIQFIKD